MIASLTIGAAIVTAGYATIATLRTHRHHIGRAWRMEPPHAAPVEPLLEERPQHWLRDRCSENRIYEDRRRALLDGVLDAD